MSRVLCGLRRWSGAGILALMCAALLGSGVSRSGQQQPQDPIRTRVAGGDFDGALAAARQLEGDDPALVWRAIRADPGRWMPVAGGWLRAGRSQDGVWVFRTLADGEPGPGWVPGEAWALANLALTYRNLDWLDEAEATYEQALAAGPLDPLLWNDWGLFLRGQGRLEEAREAFQQSVAVDRDPAVGPALTNLVQLALMHPDVLPAPPAGIWRDGLARRPDGWMLRRLSLDLLAPATR